MWKRRQSYLQYFPEQAQASPNQPSHPRQPQPAMPLFPDRTGRFLGRTPMLAHPRPSQAPARPAKPRPTQASLGQAQAQPKPRPSHASPTHAKPGQHSPRPARPSKSLNMCWFCNNVYSIGWCVSSCFYRHHSDSFIYICSIA